MEKKWFAVYTKPRWEKKVAYMLTCNGIENYCPLNRVVKQWSDRKKVIEEPLFTSYVFVRIVPRKQTAVRLVEGVINYVYWLGKPAVIRDEEIDIIRDFLKAHDNVKLETVRVNINDTVKVIKGPMTELEVKVIAVKNKTVKVILPSLGCALTAEISKDHIRVVSPRHLPDKQKLQSYPKKTLQ